MTPTMIVTEYEIENHIARSEFLILNVFSLKRQHFLAFDVTRIG